MCRLRNIAMRDYQESVTTGQTDTHKHTDRQTDTGQSDPYVPLCFAGDTKTRCPRILFRGPKLEIKLYCIHGILIYLQRSYFIELFRS